MKALAIRQPYAWLIVQGIKDVENRTWPTDYRGRFLVHATKAIDEGDVSQVRSWLSKEGIDLPDDLPRGGIVGVVTLADCVQSVGCWQQILCWLFRDRPAVCGERTRPGQFRDVQNFIGNRDATSVRDAEYVPPPPTELLPALSALERYIHEADNDYPPLVRLAFIHYQFEAIHPFMDGNGRIGRLLISLLLVDWSLMSIPLLYLSAFFEQNRTRYFDHLQAVSEEGAWPEWVMFFLSGVVEQAQDASARAKQLQDLQMSWREKLSQARASALVLRLSDHLFQTPFITIPQAQQLLDVSYGSARRAVEKLVEANVLSQLGDTAYNKTFAANEILAVITEPRQEEISIFGEK